MNSILRALAASLTLATLAVVPNASPAGSARGFYGWYFDTTRQGYWAQSFDGAKPFLEPSLYAAVDDALIRGERNGKAVLDFDPFDYAQRPATGYRLGKTTIRGATASIPVTMTFEGDPRAVSFTVLLRRERTGWLIDDFRYADGTLRRALKNRS